MPYVFTDCHLITHPLIMSSSNLIEKLKSPPTQAITVLGFFLSINLLVYFFSSAGMDIEQRMPWTLAATFILFFAIFNSLISLLTDNMDKYWTRSILIYLVLAGSVALLAWAFSSLTSNEAGSYKWIYIVLTFGYLTFLSMIGFMRKIVEFAQREEWNQPRLRTKKKK